MAALRVGGVERPTRCRRHRPQCRYLDLRGSDPDRFGFDHAHRASGEPEGVFGDDPQRTESVGATRAGRHAICHRGCLVGPAPVEVALKLADEDRVGELVPPSGPAHHARRRPERHRDGRGFADRRDVGNDPPRRGGGSRPKPERCETPRTHHHHEDTEEHEFDDAGLSRDHERSDGEDQGTGAPRRKWPPAHVTAARRAGRGRLPRSDRGHPPPRLRRGWLRRLRVWRSGGGRTPDAGGR